MLRNFLLITLLFLSCCNIDNNSKNNLQKTSKADSINNLADSLHDLGQNYSKDSLNQEQSHELLEESFDLNNSVWVDTLNARVADKTLNIYDPDNFLKEIIRDTNRLWKFKELSERNNNFEALAYAFNMLGKNKLNCSDYFMAIQYHKQAYEAALIVNDDYLEVLSLNMMGVVYRRKSAVKTALEYYTRALKTAEKSHDNADYMLKNIAISNEGIGGLYRLLGQYELAITYYKQSLEYEKKLESLLGMAINNHNIGRSFGYLGQYDSAIFYHKKSLEYNKRMNSIFGKAICYNSLGKISMFQNKPEDAYKLFIPALKMAEKSGDSTYIVNSNINLGWYHLVNHNIDSANSYIRKAMAISKRIGNKAAIMQGYELLSDLEQNRGNYPEALQYFKKANIYNDSIVNEKNQQYLVDLTILYDIEKNKSTIEKLQYNAKLNKRIQNSKNIVIILLGIVALVLFILIFQKVQAMKKNRIIHNQKEDMFGMQLELKVLQNERLLAENKQNESEKELLKDKLATNEFARQNEKMAMQNEIDHKNRELATAAAYAIKKGESMRKFLDSIEKLKPQKSDTKAALNKLQKDIECQMNPESDWENFSLHFETVHPKFFKNLKTKHQNITTNELRLCAYLLMNLSNKEIALLLFISGDAVQKAKYRLKKKFSLSTDNKLFDYLLSI